MYSLILATILTSAGAISPSYTYYHSKQMVSILGIVYYPCQDKTTATFTNGWWTLIGCKQDTIFKATFSP